MGSNPDHRSTFPPTRWTLIAEAAGPDEAAARAALEKLCAAVWYPLYAYVRRRGHGPEDAEDLVQATFIRAAKAASSYDGRAETARSWLFGITARLVQERRRSIARLARTLLRLEEGGARAHSLTDAHRSDLERGLCKLSDAKRVVIILAEVEGYTCEEIAAMLEVPVGTVWTRLHHARKELRAFYGERSP